MAHKIIDLARDNAGTVADVASKAAYTSSGTTVGFGALTLNDLAIIIGIGVAVLTYFTNL